MRAVIFDLWDTLALWPSGAFDDVKRERMRRHVASVSSSSPSPRKYDSIDPTCRAL